MKLPQKLNQTPVIIHNNCFIGHDSKKERFKLHGLWFIDENNVNVTANDDVPIKECTKVSFQNNEKEEKKKMKENKKRR